MPRDRDGGDAPRDRSELPVWARWPIRVGRGLEVVGDRFRSVLTCFVRGHEWAFHYFRDGERTGADTAVCSRCGTRRTRGVPAAGRWPAGAEAAQDHIESDVTAEEIMEERR